jgi:hypothetical protein
MAARSVLGDPHSFNLGSSDMAVALTGENFTIMASGGLAGDALLAELWSKGFIVKLYTDGELSQAGLEDTSGEGGVPDPVLMWRFAEMQERYTKELRLRRPLLLKRARKRK